VRAAARVRGGGGARGGAWRRRRRTLPRDAARADELVAGELGAEEEAAARVPRHLDELDAARRVEAEPHALQRHERVALVPRLQPLRLRQMRVAVLALEAPRHLGAVRRAAAVLVDHVLAARRDLRRDVGLEQIDDVERHAGVAAGGAGVRERAHAELEHRERGRFEDAAAAFSQAVRLRARHGGRGGATVACATAWSSTHALVARARVLSVRRRRTPRWRCVWSINSLHSLTLVCRTVWSGRVVASLDPPASSGVAALPGRFGRTPSCLGAGDGGSVDPSVGATRQQARLPPAAAAPRLSP